MTCRALPWERRTPPTRQNKDMRKLQVLLLMMCILSVSSFAKAQGGTTDSIGKGIQFENITFKEALEKAAAEGKQVFIDCYIKTCIPCKYMMHYVFPQEECGRYFNPRYVSLSMDMDEGDGPEVRRKYDVGIYPTFLIINPDGSLFVKDIGAVTRNSDISFVEKMKKAISRAEMAEKYKRGERDEAFVRQYIEMLSASGGESLGRVVNDFVSGMSVSETCQPENWKLVTTFVNSPDDPTFKRIVARRDSFEMCLGKEAVMKKIMETYQGEFNTMKMLDLDYPSRITSLKALLEAGYPAQCLIDCMTLRMIINNKLADRVGEIVNVLKSSGSLPEKEQLAVVKELNGFERIASSKQREEACNELNGLRQSMSDTNKSVVDRYINRIRPKQGK